MQQLCEGLPIIKWAQTEEHRLRLISPKIYASKNYLSNKVNIKGWYSIQLDGMSYKEEKLLRRYNKLQNIQSIHTLQLADNRTVKDRGQTNPDRGFPESLLPVKGLQRSFCGVNDNLRRCCVLLTTWPMCNTPGYVSSYKCGTKCINFDVASASRGILLFPMGNTFGHHLQDGIERQVLQNS